MGKRDLHPVFDGWSNEQFERFLSRVGVTTDEDECWLWTGTIVNGKHPQITVSKDGEHRCHSARKLMWLLEHPNATREWQKINIRRTCDNYSCVNPNHTVRIKTSTKAPKGRPVVRPTCRKGKHYLDNPSSYFTTRDGAKGCRACRAERKRAWRAERRAAGNPEKNYGGNQDWREKARQYLASVTRQD